MHKLILLRHGESDWNRENRFTGWTDVDSSEAGAREARRAGQVLLEQGFTFDSLLGSHCGIDPQHIHAHVIGEHGDSEVLTWSLATVAGMPLESFVTLRGINLSERVRQQIDGQVRGAAYTIIGGKGATYYGIGSAVTFPLPLNEQETIRLRESARVIRQALNELEDKDSHTKTAS
jgi:hypothetical protein